jgi:hypothetical protein
LEDSFNDNWITTTKINSFRFKKNGNIKTNRFQR